MTGPAIIFDTECTGIDDDREVIEAAYMRPPRVSDLAGDSVRIPAPIADFTVQGFIERYQPTRPISFGAMAVHHILPEDLVNCAPSGSFELPDGVEYLVGHSIDFDWHAIGKPPVRRICTYAIAGYLWPDCDSHSQSALLYYLRGANAFTRERLKNAHSAMTDVENNALLLQEIIEKRNVSTWPELFDLSQRCRIPWAMPFGKLEGETIALLPSIDYGYCRWLLDQDWLDPYVRLGIENAVRDPVTDLCAGLEGKCRLRAEHEGDCDIVPAGAS